MDTKTLIQRLEDLNDELKGGDLIDLAVVPAAREMMIAIKNRVKNEGRGTSGQDLRQYSTEPIYATQNQFVKGGFRPIGKSGGIGDRLVPTARLKSSSLKKNSVKYATYTQVKPNYKPRKTMYLPDGYKELRDIQGLRTDITNMSYSGQMLRDYVTEREGEFVLLGMNTRRSADIYLGQTFGTSKMRGRGYFLQASAEEIENYIKLTQYAIARLTVGILQNGESITSTIGEP